MISRIVAAALVLALAAPAFAQTADDDVKCLIVSNVFARAEKDAQRKQLAAAAGLFYAGRLDRVPAAELKAKMIAQAKALTPAAAGPAMTTCAQRLGAREQALNAVFQEVAKAQPQPAAAPK